MLLGDRLKQLREARQYTHAELAGLLNVGYAQIYRYEANRTVPSADILARMSHVFNVSTDYLLSLTDDPTPHFRVDNLSAKERAILRAVRDGDALEAIKVIVGDE